MVLGKEVVITNAAMQAMFERFFGEKLLIQDLWFDQTSKEVHLKIGKVGFNQNLVSQGFEEVKDPSKYSAKEKWDAKVQQILESSILSYKDW